MRFILRFLFLYLFCSNFLIPEIFSQTTHSNNQFVIDGEIIGTDTGSVILWYDDKDNNGVADTAKLINGKFYFSGTINSACIALLWTNLKNRVFDDSSVIHFLLEPNNIFISYRPHGGTDPIITGSRSQTEKEKWDKQKSFLLLAKAQIYRSIYSTDVQDQINRLYIKRDSIVERIKILDTKYIKMHPDSYLSGYLLWQNKRKLSVDSLQVFYSMMGNEVKKSSLGHSVLYELYHLTNDNDFRKANPLIDLKFDQRLSKINSVYDLSLRDTLGNIIKLRSFKGKYVVIDFWAGWCKPCVANIPAFKQLFKYYKPDSIRFISVSFDNNADEWKKAMKKYNFTEAQFYDFDGFDGIAAIYCKVLWVPKYIIADQNGKIINYDAPQPSEPGLKILLDNLLKRSLSNQIKKVISNTHV